MLDKKKKVVMDFFTGFCGISAIRLIASTLAKDDPAAAKMIIDELMDGFQQWFIGSIDRDIETLDPETAQMLTDQGINTLSVELKATLNEMIPKLRSLVEAGL